MSDKTEPTQPEILVTHIRVRNYRGIEHMDLDIPKGGVVFAGKNAQGKTSALLALRSALEAEGIGADSIRFDATKAEVLVDMQALLARRTITRRSTSLEALARDGSPLPKAKDQLHEILGDRRLDPLAFFLATPKDQRQILLSACNAPMTAEDLNAWCEETRDWTLTGNGLEDLARVRQMFFDQRTEAGRALDGLKARLKLADEKVEQLPNVTSQPEVKVAEHAVQQADKALAVLRERRSQTAERAENAKGTVDKIAEKRARAREMLDQEAAIPPSQDDIQRAAVRITEAGMALAQAQAEYDAAVKCGNDLSSKVAESKRLEQEARKLEVEATELEQTLATMQVSDSNIEAITAQIVEAEQTCTAAAQAVDAAKTWAELKVAKEASAASSKEVTASEAIWEKLNRITNRLTKEAPGELAKRANLIPGLDITATAITYEGKPIGMLSSAEQMQLAVMISKRIQSGRAKILTIDGLERLDPEQQPKFLRAALEGGWQVFGTRVQAGDLQIVDCYELAGQAA
jgi:recombinational DNA repair ATPase RecF